MFPLFLFWWIEFEPVKGKVDSFRNPMRGGEHSCLTIWTHSLIRTHNEKSTVQPYLHHSQLLVKAELSAIDPFTLYSVYYIIRS